MLTSFLPAVVPPAEISGAAWCFAFRGDRLLVRHVESAATLPHLDELTEWGVPVRSQHYLGLLDGLPCFAVDLPEEAETPAGLTFQGLRRLYGLLDEALFWVAGRAIQVVEWDRTHRFCGRCGSPMVAKAAERAKECPQCGLTNFPRLAPAVIVAVVRDNQILLARSSRHPAGFYSVLAGFVEPGETLEEAVIREIKEEVGIEVGDICYFGSQPWPFPHSLMIGFTARYVGGEIQCDETEIEEAGWFTADNLPQVPGPISISRRLIDWFVAGSQ